MPLEKYLSSNVIEYLKQINGLTRLMKIQN